MAGNHRIVGFILDILTFVLVLGGVIISRFATNNLLSIIAGLLASIGVGLIAVRRFLK